MTYDPQWVYSTRVRNKHLMHLSSDDGKTTMCGDEAQQGNPALARIRTPALTPQGDPHCGDCTDLWERIKSAVEQRREELGNDPADQDIGSGTASPEIGGGGPVCLGLPERPVEDPDSQ